MNLIERLWGHLKRTILANVLYANLDDLVRAFRVGVRRMTGDRERMGFMFDHDDLTLEIQARSRRRAAYIILRVYLALAASQQAVAERLGLSWDEVHAIMDRAVRRGLKRRKTEMIGYLGVDEKSFRKGHKYLTLVNDLARGRVLYVAKDRKQSSLDGFWPTLTKKQLKWIAGVALDMWDPYEQSIRAHLPEAEEKMVFDKFHVAKHLSEAVDKVRRGEHQVLAKKGDERLKDRL